MIGTIIRFTCLLVVINVSFMANMAMSLDGFSSSNDNLMNTNESKKGFVVPAHPDDLPHSKKKEFHLSSENAVAKDQSNIKNNDKQSIIDKILKLNYTVKAPYNKDLSNREGNHHLPKNLATQDYVKLFDVALTQDNLELARTIIQNRKLTNNVFADGNNMIIEAANNSSYNIMRYLLMKHPEAMNHQNDFGLTALHVACIKSDLKMVKILLTMGAAFNLEDKDQMYPVDYAIMNSDFKIIDLFENYFNQTKHLHNAQFKKSEYLRKSN